MKYIFLNRIELQQNAFIVNSGVTVNDLFEIFEKYAVAFVAVVNDEQKLLGLISQGDFRRALFAGKKSNASINEIMNTEPQKIIDKFNSNTNVRRALTEFGYIPHVTDKDILLGAWIKSSLVKLNELRNPFLIMAGGKGKRLLPLTENIPKPLVELDNKPIIMHIIEKAYAEGFREFHISVNYMKEKIISFIENLNYTDCTFSFIEENEPLGTAGSLSLFQSRSIEPIVVSNGDVITNFPYRNLLSHQKQSSAAAIVAAKAHEIQNPYGVLNVEGSELVSIDEKPTYVSLISSGIYVIERQTLSQINRDEYLDFPDFLSQLLEMDFKVEVNIIRDDWYDVGTPVDLETAEKYMREL